MRRVELKPLVAMLLACGLLGGLGGCASRKGVPGDDAPTLKVLAGRTVNIPADRGIATSDEKSIAAYREFLAAAPKAPQRAQAMRRLGDLEMDLADRRLEASGTAAADYRAAIERYQAVLKAYPQDPANDRVLYQLARAQEQGGALEDSLKTLDRLVAQYPQTTHKEEAQFRRGELLFTTRDYAKAETAYAEVLRSSSRTPFHERALYMQGWSRFKLTKLDEALSSFMAVLDDKLAGRSDAPLESLPGLTRADRELVEDTFRVTSLSLQQLQGAASVPALIDSDVRRGYEFRVYQQLGDLYLAQERVKDAADTFASFARAHPAHAQAPRLQARVIDIYAGNGFTQLALEAKRDYVERYGPASDFRRANPQGWEQAQPLLKQHLIELARHHHARSQEQADAADVQAAERWYRQWLDAFPDDADAPQNTFLLGELLADAKRPADAAEVYEKAAYNFAPHARSADAGYAALLAHAAREKAAPAAQQAGLQRAAADSARRFAAAFAQDPRTGPVLADAAQRLLALGEGDAAVHVAGQVLALQPGAPAAAQRVALTVQAHRAFEQKDYARAEQSYARLLAGAPPDGAARQELDERLAAAIYRQGEAERAAGRLREAVGHFDRVVASAPASAVRVNAQFDSAAASIALKDWEAAARGLEDLRRRFPQHALAGEVAPKLAVVYLELRREGAAAVELERLSAGASAPPEVARGALWQAAELHAKAGQGAAAAKAYEAYVNRYPQPLEPAVEARWKLAQMALAEGRAEQALAWSRQVRQADEQGGNQRTARTRTLGALASLALAAPLLQEYRQVRLVEPLARQLKLKKAKMESVLQAYAAASESGIGEAVTAATYQTAALYQDFGKAMLGAPRPKGLKKAEAEQYAVMLEEQAFPFEEKAAELYELNARRTAQGLWDDAIRDSLKALAQLRPARWGRIERSDRAAAGFDIAALEKATAAGGVEAELLNQLGIAYRQAGRFADARRAYERAAAARTGYATPVLNLAILEDLYLRDTAQALAGYERYQAMLGTPDPTVGKWVAELKSRKADSKLAASQGNAGPPQVSLTPAGGGLGVALPWGHTGAPR